MKNKDKTTEILEALELPIAKYVQGLLKLAGQDVSLEGAKNVIANVGANILKRSLERSDNPLVQ